MTLKKKIGGKPFTAHSHKSERHIEQMAFCDGQERSNNHNDEASEHAQNQTRLCHCANNSVFIVD